MNPIPVEYRFAPFALICLTLVITARGKEGESAKSTAEKAPAPPAVSAKRMESQRVPIAFEAVGQAGGFAKPSS